VEYKDALWAITHIVMYETPRKYYHLLIKLNRETHQIEQYSLPFYFRTNHIEYCLGIDIQDETLTAIVSQNDSSPIVCTSLLSDLVFLTL